MFFTETVEYNARTSSWELSTALGTIIETYETNDVNISPLYNTSYEQEDRAIFNISYDSRSSIYPMDHSVFLREFAHKLVASGDDPQYTAGSGGSQILSGRDTYSLDEDWKATFPDIQRIMYAEVGGAIFSNNYSAVADIVKGRAITILDLQTVIAMNIQESELQDFANLTGRSVYSHQSQARQNDGKLHLVSQTSSNNQYDLVELRRQWIRGNHGATSGASGTVALTYSMDPSLPAGSTSGPVYVSSTHTTGNDFEGNAYDYTLATVKNGTGVFPSSLSGTLTDYQGATINSINLSWASVTRYSVGSLATSPVISTTRWEITSANTGLSSWSMGITRDPMPANMRSIVSSILSRFSKSVMTAGATFMGALPLNYLSAELAQPGDPVNFRSMP